MGAFTDEEWKAEAEGDEAELRAATERRAIYRDRASGCWVGEVEDSDGERAKVQTPERDRLRADVWLDYYEADVWMKQARDFKARCELAAARVEAGKETGKA